LDAKDSSAFASHGRSGAPEITDGQVIKKSTVRRLLLIYFGQCTQTFPRTERYPDGVLVRENPENHLPCESRRQLLVAIYTWESF
jgi:hypothetical protein